MPNPCGILSARNRMNSFSNRALLRGAAEQSQNSGMGRLDSHRIRCISRADPSRSHSKNFLYLQYRVNESRKTEKNNLEI